MPNSADFRPAAAAHDCSRVPPEGASEWRRVELLGSELRARAQLLRCSLEVDQWVCYGVGFELFVHKVRRAWFTRSATGHKCGPTLEISCRDLDCLQGGGECALAQ